jgi:hypothetical protein
MRSIATRAYRRRFSGTNSGKSATSLATLLHTVNILPQIYRQFGDVVLLYICITSILEYNMHHFGCKGDRDCLSSTRISSYTGCLTGFSLPTGALDWHTRPPDWTRAHQIFDLGEMGSLTAKLAMITAETYLFCRTRQEAVSGELADPRSPERACQKLDFKHNLWAGGSHKAIWR